MDAATHHFRSSCQPQQDLIRLEGCIDVGVAAAACCCETDPPEDSCPYWASFEFERLINHTGSKSDESGSTFCSILFFHAGRLWMRGGTDGGYTSSPDNPVQEIGYSYTRQSTFANGAGFSLETHTLVQDPVQTETGATSPITVRNHIDNSLPNCPDIELGSPMLFRNINFGVRV